MNPVVDTIVAAIAAGAAVGLRDSAAQAVRDAYSAVKALLARKYSHSDLATLEADPTSQTARESLARSLSDAGAADDVDLLRAAMELDTVVRDHAGPEAAADVTVAGTEGKSLLIKGVRGPSARVRVRDTKTRGGITIVDVNAGGRADPKA